MKRFNLKKALSALPATGLMLAAVFTQTSCSDLWSEQHPGTYYINSGETIASFLEKEEFGGNFSDFVYVLKKANLWTELKTYGGYTCFAPDNAAFDRYLELRATEDPANASFFESVESLPDEIIDSIACTHLCKKTFYCSQFAGDGVFQYPNMLDRYLSYFSYADTTTDKVTGDTIIKAVFKINRMSEIIEPDDSVQNGVVHIISDVLRPSNAFVPGLLKENPHASIFYEALVATGLSDTLDQFKDEAYPGVSYDSTLDYYMAHGRSTNTLRYATGAETSESSKDNGTIPAQRYKKYTLFVVSDSVLAEEFTRENIQTTGLEGLKELADKIYGVGSADPTDRTNSLNKLMSYHILRHGLKYNQLNLRDEESTDTKESYALIATNRKEFEHYDVEDFYETLLPHSLMRISTPYSKDGTPGEVYINRKGTATDGLFAPGIRVNNQTMEKSDHRAEEYGAYDNNARNGYYHFINGVLKYDDYTRTKVLNTRIRVMANSLSPDFTNSGATHRWDDGNLSHYTVGFLRGYCENFEALNGNTEFWIRYANKTYGTFMGYEMTIRGLYDLAIKLPPVPSEGIYEIRIWENSMDGYAMNKNPRGIVQFYFCEGDYHGNNKAWTACGIPVDLRIKGTDARIGNIKDSDLADEEAIELLEKSMRNRGYMKAMSSYAANGTVLRDDQACNRKIVCNNYMSPNNDYYLRLRQVADMASADVPFAFIEIVPKSVYAGEKPEDRY